MELLIKSTVLAPRSTGEQYLVIASATRIEGPNCETCVALDSTFARDLDEATLKCCTMARVVTKAVARHGDQVIRTRCSHCPTPGARPCDPRAGHSREGGNPES